MLVNHWIDNRLQPINLNKMTTSVPVGQHTTFNGHEVEIVENYQPKNCQCQIIPPHLSKALHSKRLENSLDDRKELILNHKKITKDFREARKSVILFEQYENEEERKSLIGQTMPVLIQAFDAQNREKLPGKFVTSNLTPQKKADAAAKKSIENATTVFEFYLKNYRRNSIDNHNMPINSTVHYSRDYENAFWDGIRMVYGDGSEYFGSFVDYLDVVSHEMTHGITGNILDYENEAGALNEHISDVFGALSEQFKYKQLASQATWLIGYSNGLGIIIDGSKTFPLRSMRAPGTAYDTDLLGKDPQPAHYQDRYKGLQDNGGVHINSGIPNHAFYLAAIKIGGFAWEKAGLVWYVTAQTTRLIKPNATMNEFANATLMVAKKLFAQEPNVYEAILESWKKVGVIN